MHLTLSLKKQQRGYLIIEMLVGLVVGIFVMAGTLSVFLHVSKASNENMRTARLNHELRTAMTLMVNDIRRAGFWNAAVSNLNAGVNNNPFMSTTTSLRINAANNCILLAYDLNKNSTLPVLNDPNGDDRFGYRLINNKLQARPKQLATFDCTVAETQWDNLIDPGLIEITAFTLTNTPVVIDADGAGPGTATLTQNIINLTVTGRLIQDIAVSRTFSETVRVRNDIFAP